MSKDTISRQDAIDIVRKCSVKEVTPSYMLIDKAEAMTELMLLPSAESNLMTVTIGIDKERLNEIVEEVGRRLAAETEDADPRKGKWEIDVDCEYDVFDIAGERTWAIKATCSECGFTMSFIEGHGVFNYCPNCGARMEDEDENQ